MRGVASAVGRLSLLDQKAVEKAANAAVTVYVALCFAIVVSLITILVHSVRISGAQTIVAGAAELAMDSSFAMFERELLEKYGILLFDGGEDNKELDEQALADAIKEKIECNLGNGDGLLLYKGHDFFGIQIDSVEIKNAITPQQRCGLLWRTMAVDYEKCGAAIDFAKLITGYEDEVQKCNDISKAVKVMEPCYEAVVRVQNCYLEFAGLIDGVKTNDGGIDYDNITLGSQFVKRLLIKNPSEISKEDISISADAVYNAVIEQGEDFNNFFCCVMDTFGKVKSGNELLKETFSGYISILQRYLTDIRSANEKALGYEEKIRESQQKVSESIALARTELEKLKDSMDGEVYQSFLNELDGLIQYSQSDMSESMQKIFIIISNNIDVLNSTLSLCADIDMQDKQDMESKYTDYATAQGIIKMYRTDGMYIDYSKIPDKKSSGNRQILESLKKFVNDGVLGLCLPDDVELSERKSVYSDLASDYSVRGERSAYVDDAALDLMNEAVFYYYLSNHCSSFIQPGNSILEYELEYIYSGKNDDRTNLSNAVLSIYAARLAFNTAYVFSNAQMRSEALTLATSVLGFTGIYAAVKAAQYLIMVAWAAGESVIDVKTLLMGNKVPLVKKEGEWQLSLESLLKLRFDVSGTTKGSVDKADQNKDIQKTATDTEVNQRGWKYETYLLALLLLKDRQETAFLSMDVVELYMISKGAENFRLKNYVYGLEAEIKYHLKNTKKIYTEKCAYIY